MITRVFLSFIAIAFLAFGTWSFIDPIGMASGLGVSVSGPNGAYEMRGIYGGVSLAAGVLAASGVVWSSMARPALWFIVTYMGGYIFARIGALALGPAPTPDFYAYIAFEAFSLVAALFALRARA